MICAGFTKYIKYLLYYLRMTTKSKRSSIIHRTPELGYISVVGLIKWWAVRLMAMQEANQFSISVSYPFMTKIACKSDLRHTYVQFNSVCLPLCMSQLRSYLVNASENKSICSISARIKRFDQYRYQPSPICLHSVILYQTGESGLRISNALKM